MSLGNSLFQARKKCGLSQEDVADKLGVSRQTVSKNGKPMKRFLTFANRKRWRFFIMYHWMN